MSQDDSTTAQTSMSPASGWRVVAFFVFLAGFAVYFAMNWLAETMVTQTYEERLSERYVLTIRIQESSDPAYDRFRVTFHDSPELAAYVVDRLKLKHSDAGWSFASVYDDANGVRCVYDEAGGGFLLLFHEQDDDLWVTGRRFGWQGSKLGDWEDRLDVLKAQYPAIPYDTLPKYKDPSVRPADGEI